MKSLSELLKGAGDGRPDAAALCLQEEEGDAPEDDEPSALHHPDPGHQPQPEELRVQEG